MTVIKRLNTLAQDNKQENVSPVTGCRTTRVDDRLKEITTEASNSGFLLESLPNKLGFIKIKRNSAQEFAKISSSIVSKRQEVNYFIDVIGKSSI